MHTYEIRVFHDDGSLALLTAQIQMTDGAAIRSGAAMAQGRQYEIWRRLECCGCSRSESNGSPIAAG